MWKNTQRLNHGSIISEIFSVVKMNNKFEWKNYGYFFLKYDISPYMFKKMRSNGFPFKKIGSRYYYREQDIHDYFSGKIGNDIVER